MVSSLNNTHQEISKLGSLHFNGEAYTTVAIIGSREESRKSLVREFMRANVGIAYWNFSPSDHQHIQETNLIEYGCVNEKLTRKNYPIKHDFEQFMNEHKHGEEGWCKTQLSTLQNDAYPSACLIVDSIAAFNLFNGSTALSWLHYTSRHLKLCFLESMGHPRTARPVVRKNWSHIFIFSLDSDEHVALIHKEFCEMFPLPQFNLLIKQATIGNGALVLDLRNLSSCFTDWMFQYQPATEQ